MAQIVESAQEGVLADIARLIATDDSCCDSKDEVSVALDQLLEAMDVAVASPLDQR